MKIGERKLRDYLTIKKIPLAPNSLDPNIFYSPEDGSFDPKVLPQIHSQITTDVELICGEQYQRIKKYLLVGDYDDFTLKSRTKPLKIILVLNKDLMDLDLDGILAEAILRASKEISGRLAVGTLRPINYVPSMKDVKKENYEGIYDLFTNEWIKIPSRKV